MNIFADSWHGREKLWVVFWIYNLLAGYILETIVGFFADNSYIALIVYIIIFVPWSIWTTVSLWRCAYNTEIEVLGHLVRGLIIIGILSTVVFIVIALLN